MNTRYIFKVAKLTQFPLTRLEPFRPWSRETAKLKTLRTETRNVKASENTFGTAGASIKRNSKLFSLGLAGYV
jgi:hypothetical protein